MRCGGLADAEVVRVVVPFTVDCLALACCAWVVLGGFLVVAAGVAATVLFFLSATEVGVVVADLPGFSWGGGEAA